MAKIDFDSNNSIVKIKGRLVFDTVLDVVEAVNIIIRDSKNGLTLDLSEVEDADSSALALIISWLRLSSELNKPLHLTHVPKRLSDLAVSSDIDSVLPYEK